MLVYFEIKCSHFWLLNGCEWSACSVHRCLLCGHVRTCNHTRIHSIYIYVSLYVCLWSKNIYTKGNWIRSLFFCCCCKSASIKLCQNWKMPAGEVRKNPKHDQIYLGSWFFTHLLENKLGNGCSAWFLKVEAVSMLYNIIFFLLGVQPCFTVSSYSLQKMERVQWPPWSMLCNIGCLLPLLPQLDLTRHLPLWHKRWRANAQLCHQTGSKISSKLHAQPEGEKLDDGWPESE